MNKMTVLWHAAVISPLAVLTFLRLVIFSWRPVCLTGLSDCHTPLVRRPGIVPYRRGVCWLEAWPLQTLFFFFYKSFKCKNSWVVLMCLNVPFVLYGCLRVHVTWSDTVCHLYVPHTVGRDWWWDCVEVIRSVTWGENVPILLSDLWSLTTETDVF